VLPTASGSFISNRSVTKPRTRLAASIPPFITRNRVPISAVSMRSRSSVDIVHGGKLAREAAGGKIGVVRNGGERSGVRAGRLRCELGGVARGASPGAHEAGRGRGAQRNREYPDRRQAPHWLRPRQWHKLFSHRGPVARPLAEGPAAGATPIRLHSAIMRLILVSLTLFAALRAQTTRPANGTLLAYVGTYSSPQGPEGSKGNGRGIYVFKIDPTSGGLSPREVIPNGSNPSCLALDPSKTHLYSTNETATFEGAPSGSVSAYGIDGSTGHLRLLNTVSSQGAGPAYLSVHPSGKYVLVANYAGGTVAVLPIQPDGSLGPASDVKKDEGNVSETRSASAPPGTFAFSGHDRPHAHMIQADPTGKFVLVSDLGLDRIFIWRFDDKKGALTANHPASVSLPPGDGPRHFAFHPNGRWVYSLQEESSTLVQFEYDAANGVLTPRQTISSLPKGFEGTNYTSEVMVSASGRFVYAANRLHDGISVFSVGRSGELTCTGEEWTRGDYPRSFNIDPTGRYFYVCNQRGDAITTFRIDPRTGRLSFTGRYTAVGTPSSIVFLKLR